ncbi:MAG TPA: isoprenylcysteine carboxylmethyltransferase family protein [Burkholderiaceae bacterium]|nr:isoprenylcysteine carboxylmethyltransferase family protein [Burkholderiaceae bacterium]
MHDDAGSAGAWSHRLETKIPPPLVALVIVVAMWLVARVTPVVPLPDLPRLQATGVLAAVGAAFAVAGSRAFRKAGTTVNPLKPERASRLVDAGVYQFSRNPMYLGLLLGLLALAVYLAAPVALVGPVAFAGYIQRFQIRPEERALEAKFGAEYVDYKRRVRRWL